MEEKLRNYFIYRNRNEYKPYGLQKVAIAGLGLMVLLSFTITNIQSLVWVSSEWMVSSVLPSVIVDLTNQKRSNDSLGALHRNAKLEKAANMKAQNMAEKKYFSHFSPSGISPWFWFAQVKYNFINAGENLAINFTDSDKIIDAWMESPGHRANIMNGAYTEIGVGTAAGTFEGYNTIYVVQLFGTPVPKPVVSEVSIKHIATAEVKPLVVKKTTITLPKSSAPKTTEIKQVLAEAVKVTEDVVVTNAEPVSKEMVVASKDVSAPRALTTMTKDTDVLFSDFISTTTGALPASVDPIPQSNSTHTPYLFELLTQPHMVLQILFVGIGFIVLVSLLLSVFIEIKKQHPIQIAYSLTLLILMFGLFKLHEVMSSGVTIM